MTAAKRLGLYSAFRAWVAIFLRSSLTPRLTVETMFWREGISGGRRRLGFGVAGVPGTVPRVLPGVAGTVLLEILENSNLEADGWVLEIVEEDCTESGSIIPSFTD